MQCKSYYTLSLQKDLSSSDLSVAKPEASISIFLHRTDLMTFWGKDVESNSWLLKASSDLWNYWLRVLMICPLLMIMFTYKPHNNRLIWRKHNKNNSIIFRNCSNQRNRKTNIFGRKKTISELHWVEAPNWLSNLLSINWIIANTVNNPHQEISPINLFKRSLINQLELLLLLNVKLRNTVQFELQLLHLDPIWELWMVCCS